MPDDLPSHPVEEMISGRKRVVFVCTLEPAQKELCHVNIQFF
jgi:hypothetical protein